MKANNKRLTNVLAGIALALTGAASAAGNPNAEADETSAFRSGGYVAPMGSLSLALGSTPLNLGLGGTLAVGYRRNFWAIEGRGLYSSISVDGGSRAHASGAGAEALLFPFMLPSAELSESAPFRRWYENAYVIAGGGAQDLRHYPGVGSSVGTTFANGGVGDLIPLHWSRYDFAIRFEALYQAGLRQENPKTVSSSAADIDAPKNFKNVLFNLGVQLPIGLAPEPAAPLEPPVKVVATVAEAAPPPPPPKAECRSPAPGEKLTLDGCGAGDVIALNGVSFEFNKATLTVNARNILDQVGAELAARPDIKIELAGHTDSRGSAQYNQKLSQSRAASVRDYFISHGIAAERMTAVGYGETQPVASNDTDEGRERNRRVELRITDAGAPVSSPSATADVPDASAPTAAAPADSQ